MKLLNKNILQNSALKAFWAKYKPNKVFIFWGIILVFLYFLIPAFVSMDIINRSIVLHGVIIFAIICILFGVFDGILKARLNKFYIYVIKLCSFLLVPIVTISFISPLLVLNENQILYLLSASAQVVATIYGFVITGYIFLRNELDRKAGDDDSLEEIVQFLKHQYFGAIICISFFTFLSIVLCFLVISCEDFPSVELFNTLFNITMGIIISDLCLVIEFVLEILRPKSIEDASKKLAAASSSDSSGNDGDLNKFLSVFNQIESMLREEVGKWGYTITGNFSGYNTPKYISNPRLIDIFFKKGLISSELKSELLRLVSLRNSIVHSTEVLISKADEEDAVKILESLKKALQQEE